jgi:rhamnosyl/mannosyltransferase
MRVLHFYKDAYPESVGGIEQFIHQLSRGLAAKGVQCDVLALSRGPAPDTSEHGYRSYRARLDVEVSSTGMSLSAFRQFSRLQRDADLVHYHFPWPFMDVVHFLARRRAPSIVTYHSDIVRQKRLLALYRPLQQKFLASMDRIVATSPNYVASSEVLRQFPGKVEAIPIGLDEQSYPKPDAARLQGWRERLGPRFFLFVGVLRYYKGLEYLLEALRGAEWPVAIAGAGPLDAELKARAAALGLRQVHFLGQVDDDDKMALLQAAYAVAFPSHLRSEAFGISLLEASMAGKPMVSCEIGTGTSYINLDGITGFVVPPAHPAALRAAMQRLWDEPALAEIMGEHARARYQQHFTADGMVQDYLRLYLRLAGTKAV